MNGKKSRMIRKMATKEAVIAFMTEYEKIRNHHTVKSEHSSKRKITGRPTCFLSTPLRTYIKYLKRQYLDILKAEPLSKGRAHQHFVDLIATNETVLKS